MFCLELPAIVSLLYVYMNYITVHNNLPFNSSYFRKKQFPTQYVTSSVNTGYVLCIMIISYMQNKYF